MKETFKIRKPPLFSFAECLWFLDRNLDDCMHTVLEKSVFKLMRIGEKLVLLEISEQDENVVVTVLKGKVDDPQPVIRFITEWFDMDRNISGFYKILKKDPQLAPLGTKYRGLRLVGIPDFFEVLCWCVIGQQINLPFAYKVKRRLVEHHGQQLKFGGRTHYEFPTPEVITGLSLEDLKSFQLTTRKAEYLKGIAELFITGELSKEKIALLGDENLMRARLMKIRGIGEWTANYAIMKGVRGLNCLPYGDSGVNNALFNFKGIPKKNNRKQVDEVFDKFENWKSYLVYYLWRSLRNSVPP